MTSEAFYDFNNKDWWTKNQAGEPILKVENIPISHIGTDPAQAADMLARTVAVPENLGIKSSSFAFALGELVEKTVNYHLRPEEAAGEPRGAEADRRIYAERTPG